MKNLRQIIKENLLLEKRIGQISSKIEVVFSFDVIKTSHSTERETRPELTDYNKKPITNGEIVEFINLFKRDISEYIVSGEIEDQVPFVIKSDAWELACILVPEKQSNVYWKLIIKTVFRESYSNRLRVGRDQLVLFK